MGPDRQIAEIEIDRVSVELDVDLRSSAEQGGIARKTGGVIASLDRSVLRPLRTLSRKLALVSTEPDEWVYTIASLRRPSRSRHPARTWRRFGRPRNAHELRAVSLTMRSKPRQPATRPAKPGLDEVVDVAAQDAVDVAGFVLAAQVFHHLVRLHHIAADLAAEADVLGLAGDLGDLGFALLALQVEQLGLEHLHRPVLVLVLAALVLAAGHHAGRQVGDAHRTVGHVDVLATGARGAVGVDTKVLLVDLDLLGDLLEEGRHLHGRKGGLALALVVERRDADKPVHTVLGLHQPVGVAALEYELDIAEAASVPSETARISTSKPRLSAPVVHPHQHLGPVLGIGAALTGLDLADGITLVELTGEQRAHLELVEHRLERGGLLLDLRLGDSSFSSRAIMWSVSRSSPRLGDGRRAQGLVHR